MTRTLRNTWIKKAFAALTACLTMTVLSSSSLATAVESPTINSAPAVRLAQSARVADIPVLKDIVIFNPEKKRIYEPSIVYTYEITSAAVIDATISTKDQLGNTNIQPVFPGVIDALIAVQDSGNSQSEMQFAEGVATGTITFGNSPDMKETNKSTDTPYVVRLDHKFRQSMTLRIDAQKIYDPDGDGTPDNTTPGVFRYQISEVTSDDTYAASGVTDGGADNTIFLDVYVKNNADSTGLVVYGYVLLRDIEDGANNSITYSEKAEKKVKIDGYTTTYEGNDDGDDDVIPALLKSDRYYTYNVDVKKTVAGDLADRFHEFPFTVKLFNDTVTSGSRFSVNDGKTHIGTALKVGEVAEGEERWSSATANINGVDFKLKHNEMVSLIGVPAGTKVLAGEQNNTEQTYTVSVTHNGNPRALVNGDETATGNSITLQPEDTATLVEAQPIAVNDESAKVVFVNGLTEISVTGLAFDIAPFLFMTASGVFLLVFFLRSRRKPGHDNVI